MYGYSSGYSYSDGSAILGAVLGILAVAWIVIVLVAVFVIVCQWKIFSKAGQAGWKALVPFYNMWTMNKVIFGEPYGWLMFASAVALIPFVGAIAALAWYVYLNIQFAKAYGKPGSFCLLLFFLPIVAYPMLAFGSAQYVGPQAPFFAKNGQSGWNQNSGAWGGQNYQNQQNAWAQSAQQWQQGAWSQSQQTGWTQQPQQTQWAQPQQGQQPSQDTWESAPSSDNSNPFV